VRPREVCGFSLTVPPCCRCQPHRGYEARPCGPEPMGCRSAPGCGQELRWVGPWGYPAHTDCRQRGNRQDPQEGLWAERQWLLAEPHHLQEPLANRRPRGPCAGAPDGDPTRRWRVPSVRTTLTPFTRSPSPPRRRLKITLSRRCSSRDMWEPMTPSCPTGSRGIALTGLVSGQHVSSGRAASACEPRCASIRIALDAPRVHETAGRARIRFLAAGD
jgi:hypothetical protein